MKVVKKVCKPMMILGMAVLLTGCGKAKQDDIAEELKGNAGIEASAENTEGTERNTDPDEVPDTISYVVEGNGNTVKIDAKVYADGYGSVPVFAVKRSEDKDEWVAGYAQKIFDGGEYDNIKPYGLQSMEEIQSELEFYRECAANGYNEAAWQVDRMEYLLDNYNASDYVEYPSDKLVYTREYVDREEDNITLKSTVNEASLRGYVDGRIWEMNYADGTYEDLWDGAVVAYEYAPCLEAHCMEETDYVYGLSDISQTFLQNKCSQTDAEKQAEEFLEQLGFENMELLHIAQIDRRTEQDDAYTDGYLMIYGMEQDGTHLLFAHSAGKTIMDFATHNWAMQPYVEVCVNENGVNGIRIMGNYEKQEMMTGEAVMLTFEQVNEVAKERFTELLNGNMSYTIDTIEFGYAYITYDGFSYAIVPVWCYYTGDRNENRREEIVTINALDGAIISRDIVNIYGLHTSLIPY
ncbi:MAG: DUF6034 family protein [Clostridium sp.]|nr:DUF6034 family protein [Clostridium sp.]MCM1398518.1 DUF6034 family protein [Clostridium sp.]MCM1460240.1 DUF6034 family protein [Bacteroides sp.]